MKLIIRLSEIRETNCAICQTMFTHSLHDSHESRLPLNTSSSADPSTSLLWLGQSSPFLLSSYLLSVTVTLNGRQCSRFTSHDKSFPRSDRSVCAPALLWAEQQAAPADSTNLIARKTNKGLSSLHL